VEVPLTVRSTSATSDQGTGPSPGSWGLRGPVDQGRSAAGAAAKPFSEENISLGNSDRTSPLPALCPLPRPASWDMFEVTAFSFGGFARVMLSLRSG
jgi:hypothetical protein